MKFRSFEQILWSRRWFVLAVVVLAVVLSPRLKALTVPTYSATAEITYVGKAAEAEVLPADLPQLALSSGVLQRAITDGNLNVSPSDLLLHTTVRESPHSDVIPVQFRSKNSSLAVSAANSIADATVSEYQHLATRQYDQVIDKLNDQLTDLRQQISSYNARYQASVRSDPMAGESTGLDSLATRLESIDETRAQARAKLASDLAAASSDGANSASSGFGDVIREQTLARDPGYVALQTSQAKDFADYESTKAGYTDAFPGLAGLKEKVSRESAAVAREASTAGRVHRGASPMYADILLSHKAAQTAVAGDRAQVASLEREYASTRTRLNDLPRLMVPADDFRVQRDGAIAAYTQVEGRLRSTVADKATAASLNSIVVLDHASDAQPNLSRPVAAGIILALVLCLAVGVAYLAEMLDPRIRTRTDVEGLYGSPLIGSV